MIGCFAEDVFKRGHCFTGTSGAGQQHSQVGQRRDNIWIEPQRFAIFALGFFELQALVQNGSEQVVSVRIAWRG